MLSAGAGSPDGTIGPVTKWFTSLFKRPANCFLKSRITLLRRASNSSRQTGDLRGGGCRVRLSCLRTTEVEIPLVTAGSGLHRAGPFRLPVRRPASGFLFEILLTKEARSLCSLPLPDAVACGRLPRTCEGTGYAKLRGDFPKKKLTPGKATRPGAFYEASPINGSHSLSRSRELLRTPVDGRVRTSC